MSPERLRELAAAEDGCAVSVGGLYSKLGMLPPPVQCVCCGKQIHCVEMFPGWPAEEQSWEGIVTKISAGYGSCHDTDMFVIGICDECVTKKREDGTLLYVGNYQLTSEESAAQMKKWHEDGTWDRIERSLDEAKKKVAEDMVKAGAWWNAADCETKLTALRISGCPTETRYASDSGFTFPGLLAVGRNAIPTTPWAELCQELQEDLTEYWESYISE